MNNHSRLTRLPLLVALCLTAAAPLGCKGDEKKEEKVVVLAESSNGSPVAGEVVEFTGEGEERGMKVRLYNHGDKTAGGYFFLFRYYDADDKLMLVKEGTSFEADTDFTSMSGGSYKCESKKNVMLDVDGRMVSVPVAAKRAELMVTKVDAVDGSKIESWWSQDSFSNWPAQDAAE